MLMDVKKPVMDARDLAAKRSSEMTQAAAIQASKNGYQPVKRSKLAFHPNQPEQRHTHAPASSTASEVNESSQQRRPQGLPPERIKSEQARLLTFLRGLNPVVVVDQLCRALAYFGGIPGAPPPPDHAFPESDQGNGPGSLFIGWLSEIFPHTDLSRPWLANTEGTAVTESGTPTKRPRGRPKGSKSTKTRKDKGMKKGGRVPADGPPDGGDGTQAPLPQASQEVPSSQLTDPAQMTGFVPSGGAGPDSSALSTPAGKKRGRPKGSKNKPKSLGVESQEASSPVSPDPRNQVFSTNRPTVARSDDADPTQVPQEQSRVLNQPDPNTRGFGAEGTLSQHAQNWADPPNQDHHSQRSRDVSSGSSPSRKRKAGTQFENTISPISGNQLPRGSSTASMPATPLENPTRLPQSQGDHGNKRPRVSKENNHAISPGKSNEAATVQKSHTFEPPSPRRPDPRSTVHQQPKQQQTSYQQQQPQPQYLQAHQRQAPTQHLTQQSTGLDPRQHSLQGRMPASLPGLFQAQVPHSQQDINQGAQQSFYRRQTQTHAQKPTQGQNQPPFSGAGGRGPGSYAQSPSSGSAQNTPTSASSSMTLPPSTFPSFNDDQSYLNMQYAMSANRAVQANPRVYGPSGGENQLGGSPAQPDAPNRMYNSFGRR